MENLAFTYLTLAVEEDAVQLGPFGWVKVMVVAILIVICNGNVTQAQETPLSSIEMVPEIVNIPTLVNTTVTDFSKPNKEVKAEGVETAISSFEIPLPEVRDEVEFTVMKQPKVVNTDLELSPPRPVRQHRQYPRSYYSVARLPDRLKISPFNLVYRAYQGGLQDSEVPSGQTLIDAYRRGRVNPQDLVRAAIRQGRLTGGDLYNDDYLNAVAGHLADL